MLQEVSDDRSMFETSFNDLGSLDENWSGSSNQSNGNNNFSDGSPDASSC